MARTAKYSDDLLLDAVVQYADCFKGKIKATELAEWARNNVVGLEEVSDYNFTRPIKNVKTGKLEKKRCTKRIEDLNVSRDTRKRENRNILLSTVNADKFFSLSEREQRACVAQAREIVAEYRSTNIYLRRQNDYLNRLHLDDVEQFRELEAKIKDITARQSFLEKKVSALTKQTTEEQLRSKLAEIGITDGNFDLIKYNDSLSLDVSEMLNIDKTIRKYEKESIDCEEKPSEEIKEACNHIDDLTDF